jgi:hypothetical protein
MHVGQDAAIRQAEVTDLANVEAVARATWPVTYAGIIPDEVQRRLLDSWYSPGGLSRALAAPGSTFLVPEWRGRIIGFAQYIRRSAERCRGIRWTLSSTVVPSRSRLSTACRRRPRPRLILAFGRQPQ